MIDQRIEGKEPFTADYIQEIESVLGREVPSEYAAFVREKGGAFVGGYIDNNDNLPLDGFFGCSDESGVVNQLMVYDDLREIQVLPIAFCVLGNMYVIEVDGTAHYINYYGGRTTVLKVSETFGNFMERIVFREE